MTSAREHDGALLRCERLAIGYGCHALLPSFDLEIQRGRVLLVVGRNGAGKSTWLARRGPRNHCACRFRIRR